MNKQQKKNLVIAESIAIITAVLIILFSIGNLSSIEKPKSTHAKLDYYYKKNDSRHPILVIDRGGHNNIHCLDYVFISK